jgi:Adenylate cyclase regulatory domain
MRARNMTPARAVCARGEGLVHLSGSGTVAGVMDEEVGYVRELAMRGLYDPNASDARDRLALLEFLLGLGASVEEMVAAGDAIPAVASTVILRGSGERFCRADAAERAGVSLDLALRLGRAAGLPDPGPEALAYSDEDVELLRTLLWVRSFSGSMPRSNWYV